MLLQSLPYWLLFLVSLSFSNELSSMRSSFLAQKAMQGGEQGPGEEVVLDVPVDSTYVIGPGDLFDVFFEDSKKTVQVGPEGSIILEELGGVNIKGLPLFQAKQVILDLVSKKYPRSFCFVHLVRVRKFFVGVYGAVANARQLNITANLRLSYAIGNAGGFLPTANKEFIQVIRGKDTTVVNFLDIEMRGQQEKDLILNQGDIIIVPFTNSQSSLISIRANGTIQNTSYKEGHTLWQYLENLDINRRDNAILGFTYYSTPAALPEFVIWEKSGTFIPQAGSIIDLQRSSQVVMVGGAIAVPGPKNYVSGWTAASYLGQAGILPTSADLSQIMVIRADGTRLTVDPQKDPIYPGDYIYIPLGFYERLKDVTMFLSAVASIFLTVIIAHSYLK